MLDSCQIRRLQGLVAIQSAAGTPISRRDIRLIRGLLFALYPQSELGLEVQGFLLNDLGLSDTSVVDDFIATLIVKNVDLDDITRVTKEYTANEGE